MGKIADAIRGLTLAEQPKRRLLTLDKEFEGLESEIQRLKTENQRLQAQVKPLERENEQLKTATLKTATSDQDRLDELCEKILITTANSDHIVREQLIERLQLGEAKGQYLFDILRDKKFVTFGGQTRAGMWVTATPAGRKYLASHNLSDEQ